MCRWAWIGCVIIYCIVLGLGRHGDYDVNRLTAIMDEGRELTGDVLSFLGIMFSVVSHPLLSSVRSPLRSPPERTVLPPDASLSGLSSTLADAPLFRRGLCVFSLKRTWSHFGPSSDPHVPRSATQGWTSIAADYNITVPSRTPAWLLWTSTWIGMYRTPGPSGRVSTLGADFLTCSAHRLHMHRQRDLHGASLSRKHAYVHVG